MAHKGIKELAEAPWRRNLLRHAVETLVIFELVLSVIFFIISYLISSMYFRGVAVGLLIAWVTGGVVILFKRQVSDS